MRSGRPFLTKSLDLGMPEDGTIKLGGVPNEGIKAKAVLIPVIIALREKLKPEKKRNTYLRNDVDEN